MQILIWEAWVGNPAILISFWIIPLAAGQRPLFCVATMQSPSLPPPPFSYWLIVLIYVSGVSQYHRLDLSCEAVSYVL